MEHMHEFPVSSLLEENYIATVGGNTEIKDPGFKISEL